MLHTSLSSCYIEHETIYALSRDKQTVTAHAIMN